MILDFLNDKHVHVHAHMYAAMLALMCIQFDKQLLN